MSIFRKYSILNAQFSILNLNPLEFIGQKRTLASGFSLHFFMSSLITFTDYILASYEAFLLVMDRHFIGNGFYGPGSIARSVFRV